MNDNWSNKRDTNILTGFPSAIAVPCDLEIALGMNCKVKLNPTHQTNNKFESAPTTLDLNTLVHCCLLKQCNFNCALVAAPGILQGCQGHGRGAHDREGQSQQRGPAV